jgi:hypothetical protein
VEIIWITPPGCKQLARISRNLRISPIKLQSSVEFLPAAFFCSAERPHLQCWSDRPGEGNYALERPQTESVQPSSRLRNNPSRAQSMIVANPRMPENFSGDIASLSRGNCRVRVLFATRRHFQITLLALSVFRGSRRARGARFHSAPSRSNLSFASVTPLASACL